MDEQTDHHQPQPAQPPQPVAATPRRGRPVLLFAVGLLVGASMVGAAWAISAISATSTTGVNQQPFMMTGTLDLGHVSSCTSSNGYSDVTTGALVTVYDAAGKVAALGELENPDYIEGNCLYKIAVPNVPGGEQFYQIEVTHRGRVTVTGQAAREGRVDLTLGG